MFLQLLFLSALVAVHAQILPNPATNTVADPKWCEFPYHLRGRFVMMPRDRSNIDTGHYVHVRDNHVQIDLLVYQGTGTTTQSKVFYCKEAPDNEYHFMLSTADEKRILCLQFPVVMDSNVQYEVRRTNYADEGQAYFDATDPGKANPTLSDTCNMYRNSGIPLRRSFSGKCMVPNLLRGTWNYGGAEYDGMTFTDRTLTLDETAGGQSVQLSCERSDYNPVDDVHMFAYRASNITQDPSGRKMDGVLCLKMKVDQNTNSITVHRFNSGQVSLGDSIRMIDYFKPIYMQDPDTCDLINQPLPGVVITKRILEAPVKVS